MDERRLLEHFCEQTHPRLVGALSLAVGDRFLAEELAQEALLRACQRWSYVRDLQSPGGWCYRVGVNLGRNVVRRRVIERRANARVQEVDGHIDPDVADRLAVQEALGGLTAKQRDAVILRYYLGLTAEESGSLLGLSQGAVRGLTHRALAAMSGVLSDELQVEANDEA